MSPIRASSWIALLAATLVLSACAKTPESAPQGSNPVASFAAAAREGGRPPVDLAMMSGKAVYDRYCAICHGESGGGDGFNAYSVKDAFGVDPTVFTDPAQMATLDDSKAMAAIRDGGPAVGKSPAMPPWGHTLTPGEVADVWQYIRSLATAKPEP